MNFTNHLSQKTQIICLVCVDCEITWDEWSECTDGQRTRLEIIATFPQGAGEECPSLDSESEGGQSKLIVNITTCHDPIL